ncbi:MAG: hypothetical protein AB7O62_16675 [Pirellulales bacterium]
MFDRLDGNSDGEVTQEEIKAQFRKAWAARMGGKAKKKEANPGEKKEAAPAEGEKNEAEPTKPEAPQAEAGEKGRRPRFGRGPGGGFRPMKRPTVDSIFERSDKNKDGKLTKDEIPDFFWKGISTADTDKDDAVNKAELEEHFKKIRERFKSPGDKPAAGKPSDT